MENPEQNLKDRLLLRAFEGNTTLQAWEESYPLFKKVCGGGTLTEEEREWLKDNTNDRV